MTEEEIRQLVRHEVMACMDTINGTWSQLLRDFVRQTRAEIEAQGEETRQFVKDQMGREDPGDWWKRG